VLHDDRADADYRAIGVLTRVVPRSRFHVPRSCSLFWFWLVLVGSGRFWLVLVWF
jgi:hypothetical protein